MSKISFFMAVLFLLVGTGDLSATEGEPDWAALEKKFPRHFKGFGATDFELAEKIRQGIAKAHSKNCLEQIPELKQSYEKLLKILEKKEDKVFSQIKKDIQDIIGDPRRRMLSEYTLIFARCALLVSSHSDKEEFFFRQAGFASPYIYIKVIDPNLPSFQSLRAIDLEPYEPSSSRHFIREYKDDKNVVEKILRGSRFARVFSFLPEEDVLGLYYLALVYYKGIHPIPVPLKRYLTELHGVDMSPWAQFCHDLGHSEADDGGLSLKQFTNLLLNQYLRELKKEITNFTLEEKKKYSISHIKAPMAQFARTVHELYRGGLVNMLISSLTYLNPNDPERLDAFEAFSTGAFVHGHEESRAVIYKNSDFLETLRSSAFTETKKLIKGDISEDEERKEGEKREEREKPSNEEPQRGGQGIDLDNLFETSYVDGSTSLSDQEIYDKVKTMDQRRFLNHGYSFSGKLNLDEVVGYKVFRNKLYIDVKIEMLDGAERVFREATNYRRRSNFEHDRGLLYTARKVLKKEYEYDVPEKFTGDKGAPELFGKDVRAYSEKLEEGKTHLQDYFLKKATEFLQKPYDDQGRSLVDIYKVGYEKALGDLAPHLPSFIAKDMKGFIERATGIGEKKAMKG